LPPLLPKPTPVLGGLCPVGRRATPPGLASKLHDLRSSGVGHLIAALTPHAVMAFSGRLRCSVARTSTSTTCDARANGRARTNRNAADHVVTLVVVEEVEPQLGAVTELSDC